MKKLKLKNFLRAISLILSALLFVFLSAVFFAGDVYAQAGDDLDAAPPAAPSAPAPGDSKTKVAPKGKKTTIDFEDQLIEGSRQKPELFYLLQNKDFNYKRLIRLREDFLPELRKSGEDVQGRAGSGQ